MSIVNLLGEYEVRLDGKGRFRMPSGLLTQLGDLQQGTFYLKRGLDQCLVLYPEPVWEEVSAPYQQLNENNPKQRLLKRRFLGQTTMITLDSADRVLLPKPLAEYAAVEQDLLITAYAGTIELWSPTVFRDVMEGEDVDFSALADEVLGNQSLNPEAE